MKDRIFYYPGFESNFVAAGLATFGLGVLLFFFPPFGFLGILFCVAGIVLILSMQGMSIDYEKRQIDKYTDFLIYKLHNYVDISVYDTVSIVFEKSSPRDEKGYNGTGWNATSYGGIMGSTNQVISFEMYLYGFTKEKYFLVEFGSHAEARAVAIKLRDKLNFKIEDTIQQGIDLYKKHPTRRRR